MHRFSEHRVEVGVDQFCVGVLVVDPGRLIWAQLTGNQLIEVQLGRARGKIDGQDLVVRRDWLIKHRSEDLFLHVRFDPHIKVSVGGKQVKKLGQFQNTVDGVFHQVIDVTDGVEDHAGGLLDRRSAQQQARFCCPVLAEATDIVLIKELAVFGDDFCAARAEQQRGLVNQQVGESVKTKLIEQKQQVDFGGAEVCVFTIQGDRPVTAQPTRDRPRRGGA